MAGRGRGQGVDNGAVARINPSILSADFVNMQADLERIATADFVTSTSWTTTSCRT
jgi:ribulose-phosphate 3-epimerase